MHGGRIGCGIVGIALALGAGPAEAIDFDDPEAEPLHFAVETVSGEAVTTAAQGSAEVTYYNLKAPAEDAEFTTTTKLSLSDSTTWYVRVDLDGMVFSATPELSTSGAGSGSGFASTESDVVVGGAAQAFVIYRLPTEDTFARDLAFNVSIRDTLAVPAGEGRYNATIALYDNLSEAFERDSPLSRAAFGGEKTVVVMTSGLDIGIESGIAVADVDKGFMGFTPESASGVSSDPANPSAPAVLGSVAVEARQAGVTGRQPAVYAARGGRPVTAEDLIESVAVRVEGDMTFGTFDLRTGTGADRCLLAAPPDGTSAGAGVLTLAPPLGDDAVTTVGTATAVHRETPFGKRNLCIRLPEPEPGETPVRIPIGLYEATVSVAPPGGGDDVVQTGIAGEIRRSGARVEINHLTTSERYDQRIVIVNRGRATVFYEFVSFQAEEGVTVTLTPEAAAVRDSGLNTIGPGSAVVLTVAETLRIAGHGADEPPATAATLSLNADENLIQVATVQTNRGEGSTDTVVYAARPAVEPEDDR